MSKEPKWLKYAKKLQMIAQAGLTYSDNKYDLERFKQIQEISMDIIKDNSSLDSEKVEDLFIDEVGYPTPKIDVRAVVFKEEKILLVKEKIDGLWALPGGWADSHLSLKENIIKESMEEAGAKVQPKRIIAVQDRKKHNKPPMPYGMYKIFVQSKLISINFKENLETSEAEFFSLDSLPSLSTGRNTKEQIRFCFDIKDKNICEPIFD